MNNHFNIAISYSRDSENYVKQLVEILSNKYSVFFDIQQYKMLVCKFLHEVLYDVFYNQSDFAVLIITHEYLKRMHPMWEAKTVIAKSVSSPGRYFIVLADDLDATIIKQKLCINDNYKFCRMAEVADNPKYLCEIIEERIKEFL